MDLCSSWLAYMFAVWTEKCAMAEGYDADIAVFRMMEKPTVFEDFRGACITGNQLLIPQMTVKAGTIVYRQVAFS